MRWQMVMTNAAGAKRAPGDGHASAPERARLVLGVDRETGRREHGQLRRPAVAEHVSDGQQSASRVRQDQVAHGFGRERA